MKMNLLHTIREQWHEESKNRFLHDQISSSSSQFSARRQDVNTLFIDLSASIFAVNQNASINKNSKSSNSRSLRQHTFAKSISFCLCFVLRNRSFHHTNLQMSSRSRFSFSWSHIFTLVFSHIFCFRIYLFTSIASVLNLSASTMVCHDIYASVNGSLDNVDR